MNRYVLPMIGILLLLYGVVTSAVSAVDCTVPISGDMTIGSSCTFPGTTNGVDAGIGTSNTARLFVSGGATLTIGATQTISAGTLEPSSGGVIAVIQGGQIKVGYPIWMYDADADGYPSSTTMVAQDTTPGAEYRRRNLLTSFSTLDVNDSNIACYQNLTLYVDTDGDGYGAGSSSAVCSGASAPSGYSVNSTDCNDGNAGISPGAAEIRCNGVDEDCNGSDAANYYNCNPYSCCAVYAYRYINSCSDGRQFWISSCSPGGSDACNSTFYGVPITTCSATCAGLGLSCSSSNLYDTSANPVCSCTSCAETTTCYQTCCN